MDEQDFMASVLSEMNDEELEAFCDALAENVKANSKKKLEAKEDAE